MEIKAANLGEVVLKNIEENSKIGIEFIGNNSAKFISYKELYDRSLQYLYVLKMYNIKRGECVILQIEDNEIFLYIFWACLLGGIIPIPFTFGKTVEHVEKVVKSHFNLNEPYFITEIEMFTYIDKYEADKNYQYDCRLLREKKIIVNDITSRISDKQSEMYSANKKDIAYIQYSSGSTGDPRGVVLTHENLLVNISAIINSAKFTHNDSFLSWMPLTHDMGMIGFHLVPIMMNVSQYNMPPALFIMNPKIWFKSINNNNATILASPNFGYRHLLNYIENNNIDDCDLSSVRLIFNGAEPISYNLSNEFLSVFSRYGLKENTMYTVYGMADATLAVAFPKPGEKCEALYLDRNYLKIGDKVVIKDKFDKRSIPFLVEGHAVENCEIRICDNDDNELSDEHIGHILIKGKGVTAEYYNNHSANERLITSTGWVRTEDLGVYYNRRLIIIGRNDDFIQIGNTGAYSHEIEDIIIKNRAIKFPGVVASAVKEKDAVKLVIFVIYYNSQNSEYFKSASKLISNLVKNKTGLAVSDIIPVNNIPRTTSGKVKRYKLREKYQLGYFNERISEKLL